jgi:hypothetical protein
MNIRLISPEKDNETFPESDQNTFRNAHWFCNLRSLNPLVPGFACVRLLAESIVEAKQAYFDARQVS